MRCMMSTGTMSMSNVMILGADTRWYLSIDYGFTHPTSVGLWATENGKLTLFKEIYRTGLTIDDLLLKMDRILSENRVSVLDNLFADHDAEHNERLERAGYGVTLAIKEISTGHRCRQKASSRTGRFDSTRIR